MDIHDNETSAAPDTGAVSVADIAMAALGLSHIAYIRPAQDDAGNSRFMVCAADGSELAAFASYDSAYYTARQYNLQPVRLH